jgi:hypothetical protein
MGMAKNGVVMEKRIFWDNNANHVIVGSSGGKDETVLIQGTGGVSINGLLLAKASGFQGLFSSFLHI